jgi:hypothetical protein
VIVPIPVKSPFVKDRYKLVSERAPIDLGTVVFLVTNVVGQPLEFDYNRLVGLDFSIIP